MNTEDSIYNENEKCLECGNYGCGADKDGDGRSDGFCRFNFFNDGDGCGDGSEGFFHGCGDGYSGFIDGNGGSYCYG